MTKSMGWKIAKGALGALAFCVHAAFDIAGTEKPKPPSDDELWALREMKLISEAECQAGLAENHFYRQNNPS